MAVVFRASTNASGTSTGASFTVNKPTGTVDNDLILLGIFFNRNGGNPETLAFTPPAGGGAWTLVRRTNNTGVAAGLGLAVYKKIASSEAASYAIAHDSAIDYVAEIVSYSGENTTTPVDVENGQLNADGTNIIAPTITTTVANTMLIGFFGGIRDSNASGAPTLTVPGSMTQRENVVLGASYVWYNGGLLAEEVQAAIGASGTRTATISAATTKGNIGHLLAIAPAAAAATVLPYQPWMLRAPVLAQ